VINQLFGGWTGISLIPITFDWTQITGITSAKPPLNIWLIEPGYNLQSPLIPPWFAIGNTLASTVFWFWIESSPRFFELNPPLSVF
jgi:hypothetical protein